MKKQSFRALPKLRDSSSFVFLEYGRLEQTKLGIEFLNKQGHIPLPVANLCAIMLGPGTTVTHAAVKTITASGCSIIWGGQEAVRCYAQGIGETHKAYKLMLQAELSSTPSKRLKVVERMYRFRFKEKLDASLNLQQIRGKEGIRVKQIYKKAAEKYQVEWDGRVYDRQDWENASQANRALSAANACMNGICHAAVLSAGYSSGLGFIHQGKQLAFVYDIADLYKMETTVEVAFATVAEIQQEPDKANQLESLVRKRCRQAFKNIRLLDKILTDIESILNIEEDAELPDGFDPDDDPALPTPWWEPPTEARFSSINLDVWKNDAQAHQDLPF
jgi:CRISPR-associated protein Cas1